MDLAEQALARIAARRAQTAPVAPERGRCTVDGCQRARDARGLCTGHLARLEELGAPTAGRPIGRYGWPIGFDPDVLVCDCPAPLDPSPIGECQRCRRVVAVLLDLGPRRPMTELINDRT